MRESIDQIAEEFEREHGIKVEITYGGAAQLLSQIELAGEGDVFILGGRPIFNKAKEKGFIEHEHFVAYHIPVIGVPKGNPGNITCLKDLARPDVEIALGDAKAVPIGKAANKILEKAGMSSLAGWLISIRAGARCTGYMRRSGMLCLLLMPQGGMHPVSELTAA